MLQRIKSINDLLEIHIFGLKSIFKILKFYRNVARLLPKLPGIVSLIIPTDKRAALAFSVKSSMDLGLSIEHPGGTTGK